MVEESAREVRNRREGNARDAGGRAREAPKRHEGGVREGGARKARRMYDGGERTTRGKHDR